MSKETQLVDTVINRVEKLTELNQLDLPKDYSAANAIRAAYLVLLETKDSNKQSVLQSCTPESIYNALFNMVIQGLSVAKHQGAFIAYGGKLNFQREYAGTIALAKRVGNVKDVTSNVIYKGDEFHYSIDSEGRKVITKHLQQIENVLSTNIIGAYATVIYNDGTRNVEIMSYDQIKSAWSMGKGVSSAHTKFPDQMCMKTVINRALKLVINSSDDEAVVSEPVYRDEMIEIQAPMQGQQLEEAIQEAELEEIKAPF